MLFFHQGSGESSGLCFGDGAFTVAQELRDDLVARDRHAGVARVLFNLPAAKADEVLPVLDRCAALIRAAA